MTWYVWADPDLGADDMVLRTGDDLQAVREYANEWGSGWPNARIYELVEVPLEALG
jgi:hypothetical protein